MGTIFNIQKFSLHDGPGIRTTVFLKGCPLHCPWCANRESQNPSTELIWRCGTCIGCKKCIDLNLEDKLQFIKGDSFSNAQGEQLKLCTTTEKNARVYQSVCPTQSLSFEGYEIDAESVIDEVLKDACFYEQSGGGLTLSGGEVLMQPDFAAEILSLAHKNNIHTAVETTCFAPRSTFENVLENVDLLLCDVKHWDTNVHREVVGVGLEQIFENIRLATSKEDIEVIARIPVIPGFNYTLEDADKLGGALVDLGIKTVNLLPYHNFGENKYHLLTQPYTYEGVENVHKDDPDFIAYQKVIEAHGLTVS